MSACVRGLEEASLSDHRITSRRLASFSTIHIQKYCPPPQSSHPRITTHSASVSPAFAQEFSRFSQRFFSHRVVLFNSIACGIQRQPSEIGMLFRQPDLSVFCCQLGQKINDQLLASRDCILRFHAEARHDFVVGPFQTRFLFGLSNGSVQIAFAWIVVT